MSGFFSIVYGIVQIVLSRKRIYVLISLFSLALWQLLSLSVTILMICYGLQYYACGTRIQDNSRCGTSKHIAIGLLVVAGLSIGLTVVNMHFIMKGRRRDQQRTELPSAPMVLSYINPINEKN